MRTLQEAPSWVWGSCGTAEAGAGGKANLGPVKTETSVGVSAGAQIGVSGDAHATFKKGVVDVGIEGKAAALVGLEGDVNIKVDTKPIVKTTEKTIDAVTHPKETAKNIGNETKKQIKKANKKLRKKSNRLKKLLKFKK